MKRMIPQAKFYSPPKANRFDRAGDSNDEMLDVNAGEAVQRNGRETDSHAIGFVIPFRAPNESPKKLHPQTTRTIAFQSKQMTELVALATRYAASTASVLVSGESGTGKELFSRLLHDESQRATGPFLAFNCAAVPESLIESEIFGHERGAFTGAIQKRLGFFERANGGTLLLDEISEIPVSLQAKLLRVLEEQEIQSLGADCTRPIDVRIVATSNRDLKQEVADGNFREDLYHRLNVLDLQIPPLRDRPADIPLLALHFVSLFRSESSSGITRITEPAMQSLCGYRWPGNVRELRNVIHRACVVTQSAEIDCHALANLPIDEGNELNNSTMRNTEFGLLAGLSLADVERKIIVACLRKFDGNKRSAAKELGVTARTLSNKLKQYLEQGLPQ